MNIFLGILVGLFVLMSLVTLHEFGHFLMARRNGVRVLEFGIGFPPRAIAWVKKNGKWHRLPRKTMHQPTDGLVFSLNYLPIGGFCQMDGEAASDTRPHTFGSASFWSKTKILFGGVAMNWLVAWVILSVLAVTGMPTFINQQFSIPADTRVEKQPITVVDVLADSPAAKAGFTIGDHIVGLDNQNATDVKAVNDYNQAHAGTTAHYIIENASGRHELTATLNSTEADYFLGIVMSDTKSTTYSSWSAPLVGLGLTAQLTHETFKGVATMLGNLISGLINQFSTDSAIRASGREALEAAGDSVSGPIGIVGIIFPAFTAAGPTNLAFLAAIISISLACMNVLPIPALDGGRWLLIALFKFLKKPLTKEIEEKIVSRAFTVLLFIIFIITILDISRFF